MGMLLMLEFMLFAFYLCKLMGFGNGSDFYCSLMGFGNECD